ncbi:MAG: ribosomal RNA small subunit methyltransferase A [Candidatus Aenigmarchaeota archaeon]|nr:ribosomal RNA small subunit methyltransferase A [Candidatus Aenigmarchaeota archaeon]
MTNKTKQLGQNFLIDNNIINKEIKRADVLESQIILEIGGGKGILTEALLQKAKKVICIELDKELFVHLKKKFQKQIQAKKLQLIQGDCLDVQIPYFDKCVANIPYSISSPLIFRLLKFKKPMYFMVQKEFAQRLFTKRGDKNYSSLGAVCSIYFDGHICFNVSKNVFRPVPKTDSAFVKLIPKEKIILSKKDEKKFISFLRHIFCHKKQNIKKTILNTGLFSKEKIEKIENEFTMTMKTYKFSAEEIYEIYKRLDVLG